MEIGLLTDSLAQHPLPRVLDTAAELGITTIELAMGNWSSAPHADVDALVASQARRRELIASIEGRGLCLEALNASGNQLHPKWGDEHDRVVRQTLLLAEQLEIDTVVLMSGLPGARGDSFPAWVTTVWPPENLELLDYQWNEVALPYWAKLAEDAKAHGITKLSVEMHGNQLVYSPPGLLRLREAIGDIIGANFDPSHLMWMERIRWLRSRRYPVRSTMCMPRTPASRMPSAGGHVSRPCPTRRPTDARGISSPSAPVIPGSRFLDAVRSGPSPGRLRRPPQHRERGLHLGCRRVGCDRSQDSRRRHRWSLILTDSAGSPFQVWNGDPVWWHGLRCESCHQPLRMGGLLLEVPQ